MAAKRIDLHFQPGWHLTLSKSGETRYYYKGERKSLKSYTRSRQRAQRKQEKERKGWTSQRTFKREMSTPQAKRWINLGGIETDDEGYPDIGGSFSQGYRGAMEEGWDIRPHGAFAEFLEDEVDIREEDADYPVGETDEVE